MARKLSGGGITSNKLVRPGVKAGPPRTNVISPGAVSRMGILVGPGSKVGPLIKGTAPQVPMGNAVAAATKCGPGGSRELFRSGSQSSTPKPTTRPVTNKGPHWPD